jgi:hypothetical protein
VRWWSVRAGRDGVAGSWRHHGPHLRRRGRPARQLPGGGNPPTAVAWDQTCCQRPRVWGKRVFRIAPLHHHFEVVGWDEITIVIRFWIVAGICVPAGLSLFDGEWVVTL